MILAAGIGLFVLAASCAGDEPIDRLTIVNRTRYDLEVKLSDVKKESWLILGRTNHGSSTVDEMVTDVGPTWVFRFHYAGRDVGEVTVDRDELRRARWSLEVPSEIADRMQEFGFEPQSGG
jgi:hypothetical protein